MKHLHNQKVSVFSFTQGRRKIGKFIKSIFQSLLLKSSPFADTIHLFDDIDKTLYEQHRTRLLSDLNLNSRNLEELKSKLSNHSEFIDKVIHVIQNISKYWSSGNSQTKDRIQKVVFPDGLVIDPLIVLI